MRSICVFSLLIAGVVVNLSCLNPFAPKLETNLATETCTDLRVLDNVLCVFRNAYAFKDTTLYGGIIASDFTFSYTDYDRGVDVTWGRDDEMRATYGLFQNVQSLALVWNNEISSSGNDTLRSVTKGFNLTVTFDPGDIVRVDGYANLTFARQRSSDSWRILRWQDESNF